MTIFDSIKYPISDPPTLEELRAVPESIYRAWEVYNGWNLGMKTYNEKIKLLRKFILEYDSDNL